MGRPEPQIDEPMTAALDGIVFRAVLSFVAVAGATSVPLLLHLPPAVHQATHAVLPVAWLSYAGITWLRLRSMAQRPAGDPWASAREVDPAAERSAFAAFVTLPLGWLAAAIGLLAHHLASTAGLAEVLGVDVPILAVPLLLATLAWRASCRAALFRAGVERGRRLRGSVGRGGAP